MRNLIWGLYLIIFNLSAAADLLRLSDAEYQEIKEVSLKIRSRFPAEDYSLVSLGRSNTAIQGFLLNMHYDAHVTVPLSNMHRFESSKEPNKEDFLFSHLDRTIPAESVRPLIFLDFSLGGKSYLAQQKNIVKFMNLKRPNQKYLFAALIWHKNEDLIQQMTAANVEVIPLKYTAAIPVEKSQGPRFFDSLYGQDYDEWAIYPPFTPYREEAADLHPREEFKWFRQQLFSRYMIKDSEINCRLMF